MATFTAIKNRGGGRGALGGVLRYTQQDEKTLWEGQRLVSGWNCTAQSARSEMQLTKERFRKTDGRQYYHFVQSFSEQDDLTPQKARTIAYGRCPGRWGSSPPRSRRRRWRGMWPKYGKPCNRLGRREGFLSRRTVSGPRCRS